MKKPVHFVHHLFLFFVFTIFGFEPCFAQTVTTGKSYVNLTRPNGGTFLPGDLIEVRATIAVSGGSSTTRVNSVRYNDTINLAKFTYVTGSLQMLSNEGRLQQAYSDAADLDSADIDYASGKLRFNIGNSSGASSVLTQGNSITNAGRLWGALRPSFYGGTCIRVYSYQIKIKTSPIVDLDTTITLSAGNFRYRIGSSSTDQVSNFPPYYIKISPDNGLCSNSIGTNAILGESGGTFGSGAAQNRAGGTTFVPAPYTFVNFSSGTPNDNYYGLANRTSSDGTTNPNVPYSSGAGSASRVFTVWDIIGDHTGAADPYAGNPPTNTGYAVIINASYETNRAFTQTITGLCEETYYEFAAWFRNICRRCGCDSSGKGASQSGYIPSPGNDSSGVHPNLSFMIDGEDYYISGDIPYSGLWTKKGFVFKTKPGQTSVTVTIRNNAPGGGGNDWAIDDIAVSTCSPTFKPSPNATPTVCKSNTIDIRDTVRCYFDNYVYYKWQRSTDGGATWTDVTVPFGPVTPTWNGSSWEYYTTYSVPSAWTTMANNNDQYRVVVATSLTNLSGSTCRFTDVTGIITLNVIDCGNPLQTNVVSFTGEMVNTNAVLKWTATQEAEQLNYEVQKSTDGSSFISIGSVTGTADTISILNIYNFTDPVPITGKVYYRIKMTNELGQFKYSRVIQLSQNISAFAITSVINPFRQSLNFDVLAPQTRLANIILADPVGRIVKSQNLTLQEGVNSISINDVNQLSKGIYILRIQIENTVLTKKVMKN